MVRDGGGAPATTIRTWPLPGIGPSQVVAASTMALATAGAPASAVTPWSSMRRRISAPSTLRSTIWGTPMAAQAKGSPHPLQWNWGSVWRYTSSSPSPSCHPNTVAFSQMLRWVSSTPLGRAVVPEV